MESNPNCTTLRVAVERHEKISWWGIRPYRPPKIDVTSQKPPQACVYAPRRFCTAVLIRNSPAGPYTGDHTPGMRSAPALAQRQCRPAIVCRGRQTASNRRADASNACPLSKAARPRKNAQGEAPAGILWATDSVGERNAVLAKCHLGAAACRLDGRDWLSGFRSRS
jgi:hypothetical protein